MASLNSSGITFDKIKLIICVNGYTVNDEFLFMEIGFWSRKLTGVIPFTSGKCYSNLSSVDRMTINYLYNVHHGINFKIQPFNAMNQKEAVASLKMLYNICTDDYENDQRKYIAYSNDPNTLTLLYKCGLSEFAVNIENMFNLKPPSNSQIMKMSNYGKGSYKPCDIHDQRNNITKPHCANIKALILAEWCYENSKKLLLFD
jgi:hypothetical protein